MAKITLTNKAIEFIKEHGLSPEDFSEKELKQIQNEVDRRENGEQILDGVENSLFLKALTNLLNISPNSVYATEETE